MAESNDEGCTCDYSYTCPPCQKRIAEENQREYNEERFQWIVESLVSLASKLGVVLPPLPRKRNY